MWTRQTRSTTPVEHREDASGSSSTAGVGAVGTC
jgi:hypothetical protein